MNCLITGSSRGIGKAVAYRLANSGHSVTLCARNLNLLEQVKDGLPVVRHDQKHDIWQLDISDLANLEPLRPPKPLKDYQCFVNSAGISGTSLILSQNVRNIQEVLTTNLLAPIVLAKQIVKAMIRNRSDQVKHIIFMSSILAQKGLPGSAVYGASKAGIEAFTRSLAREVGRKQIAINCIAPGLVETDMGVKADPSLLNSNVFEGYVSPQAVADTVLFLLSTNNITGQTLVIDNGCSI